METILEETKRRFPQCEVTQSPYRKFTNRIIIRYEEGSKYKDDGFPNPDWWWHEWGFDVDEDETKVDRVSLSRDLDDLENSTKKQIIYHRSQYKWEKE